jgi:hypothetical protein
MKMAETRAFVPPTVASKIAAIEPRARRLGWPAALLLDSNLDDYGRPKGPAATLESDDVIVAVKRDFITVKKNAYHLLRFPRR